MAEERLTAEERAEITAWKFRAASLEKTLCSERDALYRAEARLAELAAAVRAWESDLSEYCDGPERDRVHAALAAAEGQPAPPTEGG